MNQTVTLKSKVAMLWQMGIRLVFCAGMVLISLSFLDNLATNMIGCYLTKILLVNSESDMPLWLNNVLIDDAGGPFLHEGGLPSQIVNNANQHLAGVYFLSSRNLPQAYRAFVLSQSHRTSREFSIFYLAFLDFASGNEEQGLEYLAKIDAYKVLVLVAKYYINEGDIPSGVLWYKRAIKAAIQRPDKENAIETLGLSYQGLGDIYRQQGDVEQSIWFYEKAITYLPRRVNYRTSLAQLYIANRQYSEAIDLLRGSLTIAPQTASACGILGELFITTQDWDAAQEILSYCLTVGDDKDNYYRYWHGRNYMALSQISVHYGDWQQSITQLKQGARLLRNSKSLWGNTAHQVFTDILNIAPDQPSVYLSIGDFYTEFRMYDDALYYYRIGQTKWPDNLIILERIRTLEDK